MLALAEPGSCCHNVTTVAVFNRGRPDVVLDNGSVLVLSWSRWVQVSESDNKNVTKISYLLWHHLLVASGMFEWEVYFLCKNSEKVLNGR